VVRHPRGENRGIPASRNLAIGHARGQFLCFLDADDLWSEHKLATQLELFEGNPDAVMVCGPSRHQLLGVDEPGPVVPVCAGAPRLLRRGQFARMRMRGRLNTPPPSAVMHRLAALRRAGGVPARSGTRQPAASSGRRGTSAPIDVDARGVPVDNLLEDQRTFVAVSLVGPVFVDDRSLTTYNVRDDSTYGSTRDDDLVQVRTHREFERWVVTYCSRGGIHGLAVVACLLERRFRRGLRRRLRMLGSWVARHLEA